MQPITAQRFGSALRFVGAALAVLVVAWPVAADQRAQQQEVWRTSPFHGVVSGATGLPIPCLCRYRGRQFQVGERVCMQTQNGIVITRCDLFLNNTTWVPTDEACTISRAPTGLPQSRKS